MIIRCKTNLIKDIPKDYLKLHVHQTSYEDDPTLTVGREYVVTGITSLKGKLLYYAERDNDVVYWCAPPLFEVINDQIPDDWIFRIDPDGDFTISFKEWHEDGFLDNYYDDKSREVGIVKEKIEKYKNLG
jgi:hypothetical protein